MRAEEARVFALPCAWGVVAIHWFCNCNHRSQTQHIFVMSFVSSLHAWLEALDGAELNAQQSDGAVFTLAWDIYHLPLCDVGSKRHWDEQYVRHGAGLTPGLWERLLLCFSQLQAVFPRGEMNSLNDFAWWLSASSDFFFPFFSMLEKKVLLSLSLSCLCRQIKSQIRQHSLKFAILAKKEKEKQPSLIPKCLVVDPFQ